jgi:hypothetical protein
MKRLDAALVCLALLTLSLSAQNPGPDVIVGDLTGPSNYGTSGGMSSFSIGTTSCNIGTQVLPWIANTNQHPVIGQNLYRVHDGRFQMIGMSWLKHGFTALQQNLCGTCTANPNGNALGVGCSDPYSSGLNGQQSGLGPRFEVNAFTGNFPYPFTNTPAPTGILARRLVVPNTDLMSSQFPGARYFAEGQYIHPTDASIGNGNNNASYRECTVSGSSTFNLSWAGTTVRQLPAIYAWQAVDPTVNISVVNVPNEGRFIVAWKVVPSGVGFHYEIAIHNLNSHLSAGSVTVNVPCTAITTGAGFSAPAYHSGEPYSNAAWTALTAPNGITWSTSTFAQNPNANALRWGTTYSFWFSSTQQATSINIGLFRPNAIGSVTLNLASGVVLPEYQINSFHSTLTLDNQNGTGATPTIITAPVGSNHSLEFLSFNGGQPWDLAYGTMSLIPRSQCALQASDGQVVNLNLTDPSVGSWFNVLQNSPGFSNFTLFPTINQPMTLSMQLIVVSPGLPALVGLSQPNRLIIQ